MAEDEQQRIDRLLEVLKRAQKQMRASSPIEQDGPMLPPWKVHPNVPYGDIGWRMGPGEDYWIAFGRWFLTLSELERKDYIAGYPEPRDWRNFYSLFFGKT